MQAALPGVPRPRTDIDAILELKHRHKVEAMLKPKYDMSLKDVLHRIAFESEWSVTRDWRSPIDQWQETLWWKPLASEFLRPLASDEFTARGIRRTQEGTDHGHSDIPGEYWRNPKLEIEAARLMLEPRFDYVFNFGEGVMYHDIKLRTVDIDEWWPARSPAEIEANPSPFVAWAEEWKAAYEERRVNAELEYDQLRAIARADRMIPFVDLRRIAGEYGFNLKASDPATASNQSYEIEKALRQAAARGQLAVEGRQFRAPGHRGTEPLIPISPVHFRDWEFRHGALCYEIENKNTLTSSMRLVLDKREGVENVTFFDIHLSERGARAVLAKMAEENAKERETIEVGLPKWMEGRTRITIGEAGCLAARVLPTAFDKNDAAQSKARELRYYVQRGRIPVAGESTATLAARRGVGAGRGFEVPEVTLDTYVNVRDLEHFLDKSLAVWLDVQEEATWRKPK